MLKLDRRRKYYMVLDCETATLPYASNFTGDVKKNIAIAKPLIYDLGWQIIDNKGNVYKTESFLISEIFSVPAIFNTAYFVSKRPQYLEKLNKEEITLTSWKNATEVLLEDMESVTAVGAYNSMFDFKKAIPFTESYIANLYSNHYYEWESKQNAICDRIASGEKLKGDRDFNKEVFTFRNIDFPLFDLWGLSAEHILNCDTYREFAIENNLISHSGKYYSTTAESTYKFLKQKEDFIESHTALEDAEIESEIFAAMHKASKGKWTMGIAYFPFRIVGKIL